MINGELLVICYLLIVQELLKNLPMFVYYSNKVNTYGVAVHTQVDNPQV